jgi:hypothetical protein|tara:strand:- start:1272 stop:1733 length:462 start_codon:yes stop_codon:yes gene_type:complete
MELLQSISEGEDFAEKHECAVTDDKGEECGGALSKCLGSFAKTPSRWGDETGKYGVNGMFSPGLGRYVTNRREEEKIMRSMGKIPESDMGKHYIQDKIEEERVKEEKITKNLNTYREKVQQYGNTEEGKIKAITETLPAKEMLKEAKQQEAST